MRFRLLIVILLLSFPLHSEDQIIREYLRRFQQSRGPRAVVQGEFEYRVEANRLYFRHSTGSADEPYRQIELPGAAQNIGATGDRLYVWIGEPFVLEFRVGKEGPEEPGYLLPADYPAAVEALRRPVPSTVVAPGDDAITINPPRLLVANGGSGVTSGGISGDSVTAINTGTNQVIATLALNAGDSPTDIVVASDNTRAYAANYGCNTCINRGIAVIDPDKLWSPSRLPGLFPASLAINSDGSRLYAGDGRIVRAYDTKANAQLAALDVGIAVQDLALTADGKTLYALGSSMAQKVDRVFVVSTANVTLGATYDLGLDAACATMALSRDEKRLFVACVNNSKIIVLDANTGSIVTTFLTTLTLGLDFSPDGKKLYATHADSATLEVLDPSNGTRLKQIPTGTGPGAVVVNRSGTRAYVANAGGNSVTVVDLVNESAITNVSVGPNPYGVALTVPAPEFAVTPLQLNFTAGANQANPTAQNVALSINETGTFNWTATLATQSGGNWLSVSPTSGTFPATLAVSANITGLSIGNYNGTVTLAVPNTSNSPQTISVSLRVTASGAIALSASEVTFQSIVGAPAPASKTVQITNTGPGSISWNAVVTTSGATWLNISPASGKTPGTLTLGVNPQGFPAGRLEAAVSVSSTEATNSPQTFKVVFTLLPGPAIPPSGIVNAASYAQGSAVAAGSLVTIFGSNFGPASPLGAISLPLPTVMGDVKVIMGGFAAPLIYVSGTQINCQAPFELAGQTSTSVVVQSGSAVSPPATLALAAAAPGIFTVPLGNRTQGAILNKDSSLNTTTNPARPGEIVQIFATGQGAVSNTPLSGAAAGVSPLSTTPTPPTVLIGGRQAEVVFSGLTPGLVGLWQVNAVIPQGVVAGDSVSVQIVHGGVISNSTIMAIAPPATP